MSAIPCDEQSVGAIRRIVVLNKGADKRKSHEAQILGFVHNRAAISWVGSPLRQLGGSTRYVLKQSDARIRQTEVPLLLECPELSTHGCRERCSATGALKR